MESEQNVQDRVIATVYDFLGFEDDDLVETEPDRPVVRPGSLLSSELGIDAAAILDLIFDLEDDFGFTLDDPDNAATTVVSVADLIQLVEREIAKG